MKSDQTLTIAFFSTCLVDQGFPEVGQAAVKLLRRAGYKVEYPKKQTCCGQPFYNSGFLAETQRLAKQTIKDLEKYSMVVMPSGSCTTMIRKEYPHLFPEGSEWNQKAAALSGRTYELTEFLANQDSLQFSQQKPGITVTYHDSCHMNRALGIKDPPRQLLKQAGYVIEEMNESDRCCGFGGLFSVRMPEVSKAMTEEKVARARKTSAEILVTSDPGCLMQMRTQVEDNDSIRVVHIAELLEAYAK